MNEAKINELKAKKIAIDDDRAELRVQSDRLRLSIDRLKREEEGIEVDPNYQADEVGEPKPFKQSMDEFLAEAKRLFDQEEPVPEEGPYEPEEEEISFVLDEELSRIIMEHEDNKPKIFEMLDTLGADDYEDLLLEASREFWFGLIVENPLFEFTDKDGLLHIINVDGVDYKIDMNEGTWSASTPILPLVLAYFNN